MNAENPFKKFFAEGSTDIRDAISLECPFSYRSCPDLPARMLRSVECNVDKENVDDAKKALPLALSEYSDYGTQSENERLVQRDAQRHVSTLLDQRLRPLKRCQSDRKVSHCNITLNINQRKAPNQRSANDLVSQDNILEDVTNKHRLSTSLPLEREKKLLSRSVRNDRKKEFTELWMSHLNARKTHSDNEELSDDRASPYADMDLDPMEEEIISKIDDHHLDKDDESIFTKIKTVIIERSINKKKMNSNDELESLDVSSSFSTSTPKFCRSLRFDDTSRPSSADSSNSSHPNHTFLMDGSSIENDLSMPQSPSKGQLISEITINVNRVNPSQPPVQHSANVTPKGRKMKRNFIAENIRNASLRKRTPRISKHSSKSANRSQSAPRLHIDDLRLRRHNAIFEPRAFNSEMELGVAPTLTSNESSDGESIAVDLRKVCENIVDCAGTSTGSGKMVELSESVTELKNVVDRCGEQVDCLFLEKMEKEIDEIFNLHKDIHNDNAEHKEKFEKRIVEDTERLKQLDLDLSGTE